MADAADDIREMREERIEQLTAGAQHQYAKMVLCSGAVAWIFWDSNLWPPATWTANGTKVDAAITLT